MSIVVNVVNISMTPLTGPPSSLPDSAATVSSKGMAQLYVEIIRMGPKSFNMRLTTDHVRGNHVRGSEALARVSSQIDALRQADAIFNLDGLTGEVAALDQFLGQINDLNRKIQRVSSKYCPIMRFILRFLGNESLPTPIQGSLITCQGNCRTERPINYAETLVNRQDTDNNLPFLTYMIDSFLNSGSSVLNNEGSFFSLEGRVKCFKNALTYAIATFAMPVIAICTLIGVGKSFYREGCLWSIIDVPLGIALSPVIMGASAIKFFVAGILHPGLVYNNVNKIMKK